MRLKALWTNFQGINNAIELPPYSPGLPTRGANSHENVYSSERKGTKKNARVIWRGERTSFFLSTYFTYSSATRPSNYLLPWRQKATWSLVERKKIEISRKCSQFYPAPSSPAASTLESAYTLTTIPYCMAVVSYIFDTILIRRRDRAQGAPRPAMS